MKAAEMRDLSLEELRTKITEEEQALSQLHFQHAVVSLPDPMQLRKRRRDIARMKTILAQKQA